MASRFLRTFFSKKNFFSAVSGVLLLRLLFLFFFFFFFFFVCLFFFIFSSLGWSKSFFLASISSRFLTTFLFTNHFFSRLGEYTLEASFPFFYPFFFVFHFFLFPIFFFVFLKNCVSSSLFVLRYLPLKAFVVLGFNKRCFLRSRWFMEMWCLDDMWSGIAGIGLGHLLGREHDSTPQSGVEAPRLSYC